MPTQAAMKLVLANATSTTEYTLVKQTVTLGSAPDADVTLNTHDIFPYHAVIWQNRGLFAISDWNNQGDVYVNEKQAVKGQPLWPGDKITLGRTELWFLKDNAAVSQTDPQTETASLEQAAPNGNGSNAKRTADTLKRLESFNPAALEELRRQSPTIRPAGGVAAFLQQGLLQTYNQRGKGLFGLIMAIPTLVLALTQTIRAKLTGLSYEQAFPEGIWQFYTQFGLREDAARHANETTGFHKSIPANASEINRAAAWVFQCLSTIFEYESLLENEWIERTLLRLIHEAISDSIANQLAAKQVGPDIPQTSKIFQEAKTLIGKNDLERIEIEAAQVKQNLGLSNLEWRWVKKRPYKKPGDHTFETYPQYRRKCFLAFLVEACDKLPAQMGALMWDRYYDLAAEDLPAYQKQMSLLFSLKPERYEDKKIPIPLWKAKLGFVSGGRYYTIFVAHHDIRGRLLVFKPGKPDDPGEALTLRLTDQGELLDQKKRRISIDRKGNVAIADKFGQSAIKIIRPTPASVVKAQIAAILHESTVLNRSPSTIDTLLAGIPRPQQANLIKRLPRFSQTELDTFKYTPIIINWDLQNQKDPLDKIRAGQRGIGSHALTIFRTESAFVFDQSHIFYDAIWGMVISQIITDGAIEIYNLMTRLPLKTTNAHTLSPLRLQSNPEFEAAAKLFSPPFEVTAGSETPDLAIINAARKKLAQFNAPATVNDMLIIYRSLHDHRYTPGLDVQRKLAKLRLAGHNAIVDDIESMWQRRKNEPVSLFLPMDASFINPKLRLFPATFRNFLPDFPQLYQTTANLCHAYTYHPASEEAKNFPENRELFIAYLTVMTEYFKMLKRITRQGESISSAAIRYLAHLPPGMQETLDAIPKHVGALNELLKGEEVYSNVGRVSPASSLNRFMSAKDDGPSKTMVWGVMCDSQGNLKITLRDFRPYAAQLSKLGHNALARLIVQDYLEAYAAGLNQFAEDVIKIVDSRLGIRY